MKLSQAERTILLNQCRILELLDPGEATYYKRFQKIIRLGLEAHYPDLVSLDEPFAVEHSDYVTNVLHMFAMLRHSYADLADKSDIPEGQIKFLGFDGNNEGEFLEYAEFFIKDLGRYEEFKDMDLNSHMPTSNIYPAMLLQYEVERKQNPNPLPKECIKRILAAGYKRVG